jgi:kelch-like protein 10
LIFRALFTTEPNDREQTDFLVIGINSDVLRHVLDYVYTGQVDVNRHNVYDLFVASHNLSVLRLLEVCCDFLKDTMDFQTCIGVMRFAR